MPKSALLVIDIQKDFCPGGALAVREGDLIIPAVNALQQSFEHIVLTQDWHPVNHTSFAASHRGAAPYDVVDMSYGKQTLWPVHCVQGTPGADFHSNLDVSRAEMVLRKGCNRNIDSYSAFFENDHVTPTGLGGYLRERDITHLTMCGIATDFCLGYSTLDACKEGFYVEVPLHVCRGIDINGSIASMLERLRNAGAVITE